MWWDVVRPQTNRLDNIDDKLLNMDDELLRKWGARIGITFVLQRLLIELEIITDQLFADGEAFARRVNARVERDFSDDPTMARIHELTKEAFLEHLNT